MRLLVVGADDPVIRALLARLGPTHETVVLGGGAPAGAVAAAGEVGDLDAARAAAEGCQIGIISCAAWAADRWEGGAEELRRAGVSRIVAIGPAWGGAQGVAVTGATTLRYAPLLGPGATGPAIALVRAALGWGDAERSGGAEATWHADGARTLAVIDTRDAAAAAETALSRADVGCVALTAGALPLHRLASVARRTAARLRLPTRSPGPLPPLDGLPSSLDAAPARAALGSWPRHPERAVRDTVQQLGLIEDMPIWHTPAPIS